MEPYFCKDKNRDISGSIKNKSLEYLKCNDISYRTAH